jgi:hypothetical protein
MPLFSLSKTSTQRNLGVIVVVLGILVCSTWGVVKITTNHLYQRPETVTH